MMNQQAPTAANDLPDASGESDMPPIDRALASPDEPLGTPPLLMLLDGLLFVADEPVSVGRLAEAVGATRD